MEGAYPNLTDVKVVADKINRIKDKFGRIDILVNNAGTSQSTKIEDYDPEDFHRIMNLNAYFNAIGSAART